MTDEEQTAVEVLRAHLAENAARLREQEARVRSGEASAVHDMRVAARRLRSALQTCRPLLAVDAGDLVDELRWLGRVLGTARDAQVLRERLRDLVATQPPELLGPVDVLIDDELGATERRGREQALEALESERYLRLRDDLDSLVRDLPVLEEAGGPARDVLPPLVRRDARRLRLAVRAVGSAEAGEAHDVALHEVRKKTKRLRYAAELAAPAVGEPARELVAAAMEVQDALGEHQDTVMSRRFLRQQRALAHRPGTSGSALGRLHAIEEARAAAAVDDFEGAVRRVGARKIW